MMGLRGGAAKVIPRLLIKRAGEARILPAIESGLDAVAVAIQVLDDLVDWQADYRAGIYTWPIALALADGGPTEGRKVIDVETLRKDIFQSGKLFTILSKALDHLGEAKSHFGQLRSEFLCALVNCLWETVKGLRDDITRTNAKARELQSAEQMEAYIIQRLRPRAAH
jgi:hypothetical protein